MNVTIYSTPTCPFCKLAKEYLKKNNTSFTEIDVSSDETKAQEMIKKSGQMGVPVIDIDGTIIIGFDQRKLKQTLELK